MSIALGAELEKRTKHASNFYFFDEKSLRIKMKFTTSLSLSSSAINKRPLTLLFSSTQKQFPLTLKIYIMRIPHASVGTSDIAKRGEGKSQGDGLKYNGH